MLVTLILFSLICRSSSTHLIFYGIFIHSRYKIHDRIHINLLSLYIVDRCLFILFYFISISFPLGFFFIIILYRAAFSVQLITIKTMDESYKVRLIFVIFFIIISTKLKRFGGRPYQLDSYGHFKDVHFISL